MNAITLYKIGHRLYKRRVPILPKLIYNLTFLIFNSSIPPECEIGEGSKFSYGGIAVVIHRRAVIGRNVNIGHSVTVGGSFGSGLPVIGNNVWIAPGVRILGDVHVGDNVILGANAVVTRSIPDNSIAAGAPARVLRSIPPDALDALKGSLRETPIEAVPEVQVPVAETSESAVS